VLRVELELVVATIGTLALSCPRASHTNSPTVSQDHACGGGIKLASDWAANSKLLALLQTVGAYECWLASDAVATTHLGTHFMCVLPCHRRRFRKTRCACTSCLRCEALPDAVLVVALPTLNAVAGAGRLESMVHGGPVAGFAYGSTHPPWAMLSAASPR